MTAFFYRNSHPDTVKSMFAHDRRVVICTSFVGYEPAEAVPPNVVFTGPLVDPPTGLLPVLKEKDETLFNWLEQAVADN